MTKTVIKLNNGVNLRITSPVYNGRSFRFQGKLYTGLNAVITYKQKESNEDVISIINEALEEYRKDNNYDIAFLHKVYYDFFGNSYGAILANEVKENN